MTEHNALRQLMETGVITMERTRDTEIRIFRVHDRIYFNYDTYVYADEWDGNFKNHIWRHTCIPPVQYANSTIEWRIITWVDLCINNA